MTCYICGKKEIKKAVRVFLPPKDARYKEGFRDVCEKCYESVMEKRGLARGANGIWERRAASNNGFNLTPPVDGAS
jgi:hypothetical protein